MGYFSGLTANLFARTAEGRRVYVSASRRARVFSVSDSEAVRIRRTWRIFWAVALTAIIAGSRLLEGNILLALIVFPPTVAGAGLLLDRWLTRRLPLSTASKEDLAPTTWRERARAMAIAMGSPTLWLLLALSLMMGIGGLWAATMESDPLLWLAGASFLLGALLFGGQLMLLHDSNDEPGPVG